MSASRLIKMTGAAGEVRWVDTSGYGCGLITPTGLSGTFTLELPDADGSVGEVLSTDGSGKLSWVAAGASVTGSGTTGRVPRWSGATALGDGAVRDDGAGRLGVNKNAAASAVLLMEDLATATDVIRVDLGGTAPGAGLHIVQAADQEGVTLNKTGTGAGDALGVDNAGTGAGISVKQTGVGYALFLEQDAAAVGLGVQQDGNDNALELDQNGAGSALSIPLASAALHAIEITAPSGHGEHVLEITNIGDEASIYLAHGGGECAIEIDRSGASATTSGFKITDVSDGPALEVVKSNTDYALVFTHTSSDNCIHATVSGGGAGLVIVQNGAARGIFVDQNGDSGAIYVDHDGDFDAVTIDKQAGSGKGLEVIQSNTDAAIHATQGGNGNLAHLIQNGDGYSIYMDHNGDADAIYMDVDSTGAANHGMYMAYNGDGSAIDLVVVTDEPAIDITQTGAGVDIDGTGSNWYARSDGGLLMGGITFSASAETIASGTFAVTQDQARIAITGEGSAPDTLTNITGGSNGQVLFLFSAGDAITINRGTYFALGAATRIVDVASGAYHLLIVMNIGGVWQELNFVENSIS